MKNRTVRLTVQVTHVHVPDSEVRLSRAISLLLAAAQLNEDSVDNNKNKKQGKAFLGSDRK
jgi:hypothetical protein